MGPETSTVSTVTRKGRPARYLLSAIAVCGVCGAAEAQPGNHPPVRCQVQELEQFASHVSNLPELLTNPMNPTTLELPGA